MNLAGKKIILGITGSIAAYKAAFLVRLLKQAAAEVQVIMTEAAQTFISKLTLATLSEKPVLDAFSTAETWNNHVELGLWADACLIAPASAQTIAKMAQGICDNLLLATYLSARCPVFVAPAMDVDMYCHPTTTANLKRLQKYGVKLIPAQKGALASGLVGEGRLAEPPHIITVLDYFFHPKNLQGKNVLLTVGPTHESIDPVRFISNASSGKMGSALIRELHKQAANLTVISGPVQLNLELDEGLKVIAVNTAVEMYEASLAHYPRVDLAIFTAAVADYRPIQAAKHKLKKKASTMSIELEKNPDIAEALGLRKRPDQFNMGFALETEDGESNARKKLKSKNLDAIVLNSTQDGGSGFGYDTNKITIIDAQQQWNYPLKTKSEVAKDITAYLIKRLNKT